MNRKLIVLGCTTALLITSLAVFAGTGNNDALTKGCYVNAPTQVNEGMNITVTSECAGIPTDNNVFGFQIGTSISGDTAGSLPTSYEYGQFTLLAPTEPLVGSNQLDLYGISRQLTDVVDVTDFTLGSYVLTAVTNRTVDGSIGIDFDDTTFNLSDNYGLALTGWLRTANDATIVVNDIDLAWLSGSVTVKSDSTAIGNVQNVTLNLGAKSYGAASIAASDRSILDMDVSYLYVENALGVVGGSFETAADSDNTLNIAVNADMWGHMACSSSAVNLGDTGATRTAASVIGTAGSITLLAGDANDDGSISITDFNILTADFGDTGAGINVLYEGDFNLDESIDIFDLVHVGRNYTKTTSSCA